MHISVLCAESVKHGSDGIGNSSEKQENKAGQSDCFYNGLCKKDHAPAGENIADHRKHGILFKIDCSKNAGSDQKSPNKTE